MKIHTLPCVTGPGVPARKHAELRRLFEASEPRLHEWTEDPGAADIIFLTNAEPRPGSPLEDHPYPRRYPEKCFVLSEQWEEPFLLAGIYANAPRTPFWRGRFRTASYALHHPDFRNPFIADHDPAAAPPRAPDLLTSFLGRNCHPVRARLLALPPSPGILVEDTSDYDAFSHHEPGRPERQRRYYEICLRSKFILCPRGAGPNSIRLFEALKLGLAPVILSDAWIPCEGPRWEEFALFVAERDVDALPDLLARAEPGYRRRGGLARAAYEDYFAPAAYFNYLVAAAASARAARLVPERVFVSLWPVRRLLHRARRRSLRLVRAH